jgi:hypothetical protein
LFDYRYKDLETGKLNIDRLTTINSCQSYSDLVNSGTECSYEYYEQRRNAWENRIIRQQEREKYALEQELWQKEYEIRREKERKEQEERDLTLRELREYRERLEAREAELARNRRLREEETRQIYLGGSNHGQYIITNSGKVKVG